MILNYYSILELGTSAPQLLSHLSISELSKSCLERHIVRSFGKKASGRGHTAPKQFRQAVLVRTGTVGSGMVLELFELFPVPLIPIKVLITSTTVLNACAPRVLCYDDNVHVCLESNEYGSLHKSPRSHALPVLHLQNQCQMRFFNLALTLLP